MCDDYFSFLKQNGIKDAFFVVLRINIVVGFETIKRDLWPQLCLLLLYLFSSTDERDVVVTRKNDDWRKKNNVIVFNKLEWNRTIWTMNWVID